MLNRIIAFFAARHESAQAKEIKVLKEALKASRYINAHQQNQYLALADDHADLRAAYARLQRARLKDQGLEALFGADSAPAPKNRIA